MKILITGATGFAGGYLLRYLSNIYGIENVHGTGRSLSKARILSDEGFIIKVGDLVDSEFVNSQLTSYDLIIHCAAKSSVWGSYDTFYKANVVATKNLLEVIHNKQQLIYISTANIYFNFQNRKSICEDDPLPNTFNNYYAATKYEAEQIVLANYKEAIVTVLRPRAILGAGDTVVFPRLLRAHKEGRLRIIGKADNEIDFTSIKNLCRAVELCIEKKEIAHRQIYNVTNGDTINLWDEIKSVMSKVGLSTELKSVPYFLAYFIAKLHELKTSENSHEPAMTCYGVGVLNYSISLNIDKITNELGYKPVESSMQTLMDFVSWYNTDYKPNIEEL